MDSFTKCDLFIITAQNKNKKNTQLCSIENTIETISSK